MRGYSAAGIRQSRSSLALTLSVTAWSVKAAATETLKLSVNPNIGILTKTSASVLAASEMPGPSEPKTRATGWSMGRASGVVSSVCGVVQQMVMGQPEDMHRLVRIDQENRRLLGKVLSIMNSHTVERLEKPAGKFTRSHPDEGYSRLGRKIQQRRQRAKMRKLEKIAEENEKMLKRLQGQKSQYSRSKWQKSRKHHMKLVEEISYYPHYSEQQGGAGGAGGLAGNANYVPTAAEIAAFSEIVLFADFRGTLYGAEVDNFEVSIDDRSARVCPKDHYCPPASQAPEPCPAGSFTNATGAAGVDACETLAPSTSPSPLVDSFIDARVAANAAKA